MNLVEKSLTISRLTYSQHVIKDKRKAPENVAYGPIDYDLTIFHS